MARSTLHSPGATHKRTVAGEHVVKTHSVQVHMRRGAMLLLAALALQTSLAFAQGIPPDYTPQVNVGDTPPPAELPTEPPAEVSETADSPMVSQMIGDNGCVAIFYGRKDYQYPLEYEELMDPEHSQYGYTNLGNYFYQQGAYEQADWWPLSGEVSSIRVSNCAKYYLMVYDLEDLHGNRERVTSDVSNLKDMPHPSRNDWNDEIRSARWVLRAMAPVIHEFDSEITVYLGSTFDPPSYWVWLSDSIWHWTQLTRTAGTVDTSTPDDYVVSYSVSDPATGERTDVDQIVHVVAADLGVGTDGTLWRFGVGQNILRYNEGVGTWEDMGGKGVSMDVDAQGVPWIVAEGGTIWKFAGRAGAWEQIVGELKDISVGADGTVWGLALSGGVWRYSTSGWMEMFGEGKQIAVDPQGVAWVVAETGTIWRFLGTAGEWESIPGELKDISIGADGSVWGLAPSGSIWRMSDSGWQDMGGEGAQIDVDAQGIAWIMAESGSIWKFGGQAGWWHEVAAQ